MSGRRIASILVTAMAVVLASGGAQALAAGTYHRADGNISDWIGDPTMLSGQTRISHGELIYDDWLYDDYGPNLDNGPNDPAFRAALAPTEGDYRYPTNSARYGYNAADLRELRLAADGNGLHIATFLQTMKAPDAAAVTIGIDGDNDRSTGAATWPQGAGIDTPGVDRFITFWGTGGFITDSHGRRTRISRQAVNLADNAIEVDVPWRYLGRIRGRTVRLYVVTGLADPQARGFMQVPTGQPTSTAPGGGLPGSTAVLDVGFDANEQFTRFLSHWGEHVQSQDLAARDISDLSQTVDLRDLEQGVSDDYAPAPGHFYDRIFRSSQDYGEGINLKTPNGPNAGGSPDPQFLSPYQPYGLYIPADYQPGTPARLLINGHSLDVNHNEYEAVSPNLYNQLGDQRSSFVITPLARGMDTWYITAGFKDVLEVWDDTKAHYSIDDERTSIGGYSMGGYMTYRMGLLMPDKFAAAAAYVGPPAYQLWVPPSPPEPAGDTYSVAGQTNNIVYNGLDLPFEINDGGVDELVPLPGPEAQAKSFTDVGDPHIYYVYPNSDHFQLIFADEWGHTRDFLNQNEQRNLSPDEVRYKRYPSMDLPQYGLRFDGAYWVDGMVVRNPTDTCSPGTSCQSSSGQVDAYTLAHGRARSSAQDSQTVYPGPPFLALVRRTDRIPGAAISPENAFEASLANLQRVSFTLAGMGIDPAEQIDGQLTVDSTGPLALTLRGNFGPVTATLDSIPVTVQQVSGGIEIDLFPTAGTHHLIVTPQ